MRLWGPRFIRSHGLLSCVWMSVTSFIHIPPPFTFGGCRRLHSRLLLLSSALCRHLVAIAIRLVQPSLYLWFFIMLSYKSRRSTAVISVSQVILSISSCRCRRCPLHPRHKLQHLSLAGAQPLERAYCHESHYISCGLKS